VTTAPDPGRHLLDKIDAREQALAREAVQCLLAEGDDECLVACR
jgi:hypothetical protein